MCTDLDLATSCGFQFVLAQSTYSNLARPTNSDPSIRLIKQALSKPVTGPCATCGKLHTFKLEVNPNSYASDGTQWDVVVDSSIAPTLEETDSLQGDAKYFHFHGIHIKSPWLSKTHLETTPVDDCQASSKKRMTLADELDWTHNTHNISANTEIKTVLTCLQETLGTLTTDSKLWLFPSNNCSAQVHISNGKAGFPLSTAKKVAYTMTAWQRQIDSLHATYRIPTGPLFDAYLGDHLDSWLRVIKGSPGPGSLKEVLSGTKKAGIIEISRIQASGNGHFTFSQQASTFDVTQIFAWKDVLEKMVIRAHYTEGTFFAYQFGPSGDWRAPTFTAKDMLRTLDVKKSTTSYYKAKARTSTNSFKETRYDRALAAAMDCMARGDTIAALALHVANAAMEGEQATAIKDTTLRKLKSGGYGRFDDAHAQQIEDTLNGKKKEEEGDKIWAMYLPGGSL